MRKDEVPETVGPYRLIELLGRGGLGEVYRALDERLGRDVALKQLRPERWGDLRSRARLRREARALAQLSHPSIVPIYDLIDGEDEADGGIWIVMERVVGDDLGALLVTGPLELERAVDIARQVASGLAAAHGCGILHRDLKPENVLVGEGDQARIVDFGLAKPLFGDFEASSVSRDGAVVGTCRSMSPEQARGLELDPRSDLFSLGTLIYEAVAGRSPFLAATALDTLGRICTHRPPSLHSVVPSVPLDLSLLVDRLLHKAPEGRPTSASEVEEILTQILAQLSVSPGEADLVRSVAESRQPGAWRFHHHEGAAGESTETRFDAKEPSPWLGPDATTLEATEDAPPRPRAVARRLAGAGVLILVGLLAAGLVSRGFFAPRGAQLGTPNPSAEAPMEQALAWLERYDRPGNLDRAIELLLRQIEADRRSAQAYAALARTYWLKYDSARDRHWLALARPAAQRAVSLEPDLAEARVSLGLVLMSEGDAQGAVAQFQTVLDARPGLAEARRAVGILRLREGRADDAEDEFRRALETAPENPWLWHHLGEVYLRQQRFDAAAQALGRSLELRPDSVYTLRDLAAVHQLQGRLAEAAPLLQRALAIRPDATLYGNLGVLLFTQGLYADSAQVFEQALDLGKMNHDSQMWANLGDAYRWVPGREEDAKDAYLRASQLARKDLEADPDDLTQRSRLAQYLAKRGDREEALREADRVAKSAAGDAAVLFRQVVTFEVLDERGRALVALTEALAAGLPLAVAEGDPELTALRTDPDFHRAASNFETVGGG